MGESTIILNHQTPYFRGRRTASNATYNEARDSASPNDTPSTPSITRSR